MVTSFTYGEGLFVYVVDEAGAFVIVVVGAFVVGIATLVVVAGVTVEGLSCSFLFAAYGNGVVVDVTFAVIGAGGCVVIASVDFTNGANVEGGNCVFSSVAFGNAVEVGSVVVVGGVLLTATGILRGSK